MSPRILPLFLALFLTASTQAQEEKAAGEHISRLDPGAFRRAVNDLATSHPSLFPDAPALLKRIDAFKKRKAALLKGLKKKDAAALQEAQTFLDFHRKTLLRNPALDFREILFLRRRLKGKNIPGLPANWQSNSSVGTRGYDNELAILSLEGDAPPRILHRPKKKKFVGDVDLHFEADRILFSSVSSQNTWQVFEMKLDGSGLRQVTKTREKDINNYDACYLPDGRIIFTSTAPRVAVPCVNGGAPVANLFRINPDGTGMDQLCFDQEHNWCPQVMADGRILYSRWEYADIPHSNSRIMMTMNPDGTNQRAIYGTNSFWPNGVFYARPIPGNPDQFIGIVTGHHGVRRIGELVLFDVSRGFREADGAVQRIPGWGKAVKPIVRDRLVDGSFPKFLHPFPLNGKYFLVSAQTRRGGLWGLYLVDIFDNFVLLREEEEMALMEPLPIRETPVPPVLADRIDPDNPEGTVFISDIYDGPGLEGIPKGEIRSLRVYTFTYGYKGMGGLYGSIGLDGPWDMRRILGTVPIEQDGSASFRVPANTPIAVQPLDRQGKAMQLMRSWFVTRPGESLSCVGCHEDPSPTPQTKMGIASRKNPVAITPWYGPARNFEFATEVQPVIDRYCLDCHGTGEKSPGHAKVLWKGKAIPDLRGDIMIRDWNTKMKGKTKSTIWSVAYFNLVRHVRHPGIESDIHLLTPMEFHADTTELIMMLEKGHHGVSLDAESMDRIITWIDYNTPYHGRWSTLRGEQAKALEAAREKTRKQYSGVSENHEAVPVSSIGIGKPKRSPSPLPQKELRIAGWPFDAESAQAKQKAEGKTEMTIPLGEGISLKLNRIPGGEFVLGGGPWRDEKPATRVRIEAPFWMGVCEITNAQFRRFNPDHDSRRENRHGYQFGVTGYDVNGPQRSAVRLSWKEATDFCRWLSRKSGKKVRLPTEAQWEWACRAGSATPMNYGALTNDFAPHGNMADITLGDFSCNPYVHDRKKARVGNTDNPYDNWIPQISSVKDGGFLSEAGGKYRPNVWGLHDMHGNVAEWTRSLYRPYPYREDDGRNDPKVTGRRVVRGGSWYDRPKYCASGFRRPYRDYQKVYNVGFRIVIEND